MYFASPITINRRFNRPFFVPVKVTKAKPGISFKENRKEKERISHSKGYLKNESCGE